MLLVFFGFRFALFGVVTRMDVKLDKRRLGRGGRLMAMTRQRTGLVVIGYFRWRIILAREVSMVSMTFTGAHTDQ